MTHFDAYSRPINYLRVSVTDRCNLRCVYCRNYTLSMVDADLKNPNYISPEDFVSLALQRRTEGLSFTFNEASCTLLEYVIDCFNLAFPRELYRNLNTNGYMTPEALNLLIDADLDSLCIDIKGGEALYRRLCNGADPEPVWRNAREAKNRGLHVEMVNLVIPGASDGDECIGEVISRTKDELGRDTPLHFTRFYPAHRARDYGLNRITPVETLEEVRRLAFYEGMEYVYVGNVPGHNGENTYCPNCGRLLIERFSFTIHDYKITDDGCCPECGMKIKIVGKQTACARQVRNMTTFARAREREGDPQRPLKTMSILP